MQKECIILAGGLGTRLQSVVMDVPKCMAPINGQPFIKYLLDYLENERFDRVIISLGYKSEIIINWLESVNYGMQIEYVIEKVPLGTGGAIKFAMSLVQSDTVFIYNGDTFFSIDSDLLLSQHIKKKADISIALKFLHNIDRYGTVKMNNDNKIIQFIEKKHLEQGLINGGIYIINKDLLIQTQDEAFSFEKDILEKKVDELFFSGVIFNNYFIDIGVPKDYHQMNQDFSTDN